MLASIPLALAASVLCYIWALVAALGLSTLQYSRAPSIRNIMIIGFSLFMSLSIPAYIQQYEPLTVYVLPRYLVPYAAASSGPVRTGSETVRSSWIETTSLFYQHAAFFILFSFVKFSSETLTGKLMVSHNMAILPAWRSCYC